MSPIFCNGSISLNTSLFMTNYRNLWLSTPLTTFQHMFHWSYSVSHIVISKINLYIKMKYSHLKDKLKWFKSSILCLLLKYHILQIDHILYELLFEMYYLFYDFSEPFVCFVWASEISPDNLWQKWTLNAEFPAKLIFVLGTCTTQVQAESVVDINIDTW